MEIELRGFIVSDELAEIYRYFGYTVTCPKDIKDALAAADGDEVTLIINSPGGNLIAGYEMYCDLAAYEGKTKALIQGYAASIATVVMMACERVVAYPVSLVCIHNPSSYTEGDVAAHKKTIKELETIKESVINAYLERAKVTPEELSVLMDKDQYIAVDEALRLGLVDEVITPSLEASQVVNAAGYPVITDEMRRMYAERLSVPPAAPENNTALVKARLELLKLS